MRPRFQILSLGLLAQILDEAFQLLIDPGVRVHNDDALRLLAEAGAAVDPEQQIVRIPETLARQSLEQAPRSFDLYNLDGAAAVHYAVTVFSSIPGRLPSPSSTRRPSSSARR
jgi:trimethylamine:corrinoid methyltransferase-like protein